MEYDEAAPQKCNLLPHVLWIKSSYASPPKLYLHVASITFSELSNLIWSFSEYVLIICCSNTWGQKDVRIIKWGLIRSKIKEKIGTNA